MNLTITMENEGYYHEEKYEDMEDDLDEYETQLTPCEAIFHELALLWLEQNAIRVLQDTVNKKPALKRQRAGLNSSDYCKK